MSLVSQSNQPAELFSFTVNVILNYYVIYVYHLYPGELVFDTLLWACVLGMVELCDYARA